MVPLASLLGFASVALAMAVTPGPNQAYLVSRALCQGRAAGFLSLIGVVLGFLVYLALTVLGLTAVLLAAPGFYLAICWAGAAYLGWMAWKALRPGGASPFELRTLPPDPPRRLLAMGFLTNLLNPKAAALYLSLLPQFMDPRRGHLLLQGLELGLLQIAISAAVNGSIILAAGGFASFLAARPAWARAQRWFMGAVLLALALHMALGRR